ncbi:hypothetical protein FJZ53_01200 [Candidatus Woesearchaeota archaeon]|nr:hypothetical protein [Candidatus Woesearchaeota archaeon]
MAKVDCHVHSKYSEYVLLTYSMLQYIGAKDSYNELEDIYKTAKSRGMDYVAITDHDTIDGALILNDKHPDVIVGEELEVKASDEGHLVHVGVLGLDEKIHNDLKDLKKIGIKETTAYLKERDIFYFLAHVSSSASKEPLSAGLIREWMNYVDTLEVINGMLTSQENLLSRTIADLYGKKVIAGSDAHSLDKIGKTFTIAEKANTKEGFMQALKKGEVHVTGELNYTTRWLTNESFKVIYQTFQEVLLHPLQRQRHWTKKYCLDYLITLGSAPPIATYLPVFLIAKNYHNKHIKRALKLQEEILEEHAENTRREELKKALIKRIKEYFEKYSKK